MRACCGRKCCLLRAATHDARLTALSVFSLSALVSRRYPLLQRYAAVLKHVRAASSPVAGKSEGSNGATEPAPLSDVTKMQQVFGQLSLFAATQRVVTRCRSDRMLTLLLLLPCALYADELDGVLEENVYLKNLLRRLHAQIEWSSADSSKSERKQSATQDRALSEAKE